MHHKTYSTVLIPNKQPNNTALGVFGERYAQRELTKRGWDVEPYPDQNAPFDLKINRILPAEIKTARPTQRTVRRGYYRTRYQFDISTKPYTVDYLLILVAIDQNGEITPFILPSWAAGRRPQLQLTSEPRKYAGWLSVFRGTWNVVKDVFLAAEKYHQIRNGQGQFNLWGAK